MYKLSWYVIPLGEPNTGLIDLNMLYFCIAVICYLFTFGMIWETSSCVCFISLSIWLRSLPRASFISRALMCLSTWVCAIDSRFRVFVYCYLIKDRLPCRSTLSEHCKWNQHTVIVADILRQVCTFTSEIAWNSHQIVPCRETMDWDRQMKTVCLANLGICGHC